TFDVCGACADATRSPFHAGAADVGVFVDSGLILREIDAKDLVVGHATLGPLNVTMDLTQDVVRFGRRRLQLFALECTDGLAGALWRGSRRALASFSKSLETFTKTGLVSRTNLPEHTLAFGEKSGFL